VKQLRKRFTYANVMSSIAVFLVLGGSAFAATQLGKNTVGSKQLKKNAVTTAKIKNNAVTTGKIKNGAVTGAKVNLGSLGTVPKAAHANTADSATKAGSANTANSANTAGTADNANTVGGLHVVRFSQIGSSPIGKTEILNLNGLQLHAECASGSVDLTATTSVNDGELSSWAEDASGDFEDGLGEFTDDFDTGSDVEVAMPSASDVIGDGAYTGGDGRTVRFFYNQDDSISGSNCVLSGYAIG
jgi:hypothetical protein